MHRRYDIVTFDCYGTLVDWESGIAGAFLRENPALNARDVLAAYQRLEPQVEHEQYRLYRDVLTETAIHVGESLGAPTSGAFLAESLPSWTPFADTNAALERLHDAGYELGILSNVDDDLLAATRSQFTVDFNPIITAQQVQSYKPAHAHFVTARERIGARRWLHAAQSNFHDIVPANALGIPNAWINRQGYPQLPGGEPTHRFPDLASLAGAIAG